MKPKFAIGDMVKHETEECEVLSFGYNPDRKVFTYKLSSQEWDGLKHKVIEGFKTVEESEIELVEVAEENEIELHKLAKEVPDEQ